MNQGFHPSHRGTLETFRILKLLVMKTGTYNPMYSRPYHSHVDADISDDLQRRLHDNRGQSTSAMMSGLANRILMPAQQHEGMIHIPNDWSTPRGRFNMQIEMKMSTGSTVIYHIQGYTSHFESSFSGAVDPNMVFYVNSYIRFARSYIQTPSGVQCRDVITESAHVLNGRLVSQMQSADVFDMRPTGIYAVLQNESIKNSLGVMDQEHQIHNDTHVLSHNSVVSSRKNSLPSHMLSNIVDSYHTANQLLDYGAGNNDVLSRARSHVYEYGLLENGFFRRLSNVTGIPEATSFKMSDLKQIDPNVDSPQVSTFMTLSPNALREIHTAGSTEYWHRTNDVPAWVCSVLINAVPTVMMELMITKMSFRASNHDAGGVTNMMFDYAYDMTGNDISGALLAFKLRFEREIMHDLTYQNSELYNLHMSIDMMGDTTIDIAYGNNPVTRFVAPSFCDSLIAPVVSMNQQNLYNAAMDIGSMLSAISATPQNSSFTPNMSV